MKALRVVLILCGLTFVFGLFSLMKLWPSGWVWIPRQPEYEQMILGLYATLGVFLLIAAKHPLHHRSLIWFTVWSSVVHATIMLIQAVVDRGERGHLLGDVPALYIVAIALTICMARLGRTPQAASSARRGPST